LLPSGTTDELEGRSWDMVGATTLRGTWQKWRRTRVISERGDDRPCREASELEPPLGERLMRTNGNAWQATNGRWTEGEATRAREEE
jgi:hypothetical protein